MSPEMREREPVREFQLEGFGLILTAAAVILALGLTFWFGRLYERRYGESLLEGETGAYAGAGDVEPESGTFEEVDADEGVTYFDTVEGTGKEAEPGREARPAPVKEAPPESEPDLQNEAEKVVSRESGPFYVQVFAGRDRVSAERLITKLTDRSYPVRLFTVKEQQRSLYKVLVGGYPGREDAVPVVDALKKDGFAGAWVTRIDPE